MLASRQCASSNTASCQPPSLPASKPASQIQPPPANPPSQPSPPAYYSIQVEEMHDPTLAERPMAVYQKYLVVTANYLARERGVRGRPGG